MKFILNILFILLALNCFSQTVTIEYDSTVPKSILNDIDIGDGDDIIATLKSTKVKEEEKMKLADSVFGVANYVYPPVLLAASRVFYQNRQPYKAARMYYLGMVRARVDYELSRDTTLTKLLTSLKMVYGVSIINFCVQNVDSFKSIIIETMEKVDTCIGHYDHRWIMFHSSKIFHTQDKSKLTNDDLIAPKQNWEAIKNRTLNDYYQEFLGFLSSIGK